MTSLSPPSAVAGTEQRRHSLEENNPVYTNATASTINVSGYEDDAGKTYRNCNPATTNFSPAPPGLEIAQLTATLSRTSHRSRRSFGHGRHAEDGHGVPEKGGETITEKKGNIRKVWPLTFLGIKWGEGVYNDVRRRTPYYWSDWTDAWDYRILPSTVFMYFANLLPALAFSFDMFESTGMSYGVNEVLLASFLGAGVFCFFAAQPLCIVGVTGPITVFNYTVYDIIKPRGTPYLPFMCWICLWAMVMHIILAITNASNAVRWVTRFSCDVFGFYVACIYIQKGIQILTLQWKEHSDHGDVNASAHLSISISLLVLVIGYLCGLIGRSKLFNHPVRTFLRDYGTPLTVVFFTGYQYIGKMRDVDLLQLPTARAFMPTLERGSWLVKFWECSVEEVFLAIPFAILLTILFYFDHNISSLICQGTEFPLRKPGGFHWDILLLGITTGISGILGIPAPNGLIPQAPFHTASLCVTKQIQDTKTGEYSNSKTITVTTHVVEQRMSNLLQGGLILATMSGPLLSVLGLIPQAVLAGLFFVMGIQALEANGMTHKILYVLCDKDLVNPGHTLRRVRNSRVWAFLGVEAIGFAATFAITQTIAAVGFPVVVAALVPLRKYVMVGNAPDWGMEGMDWWARIGARIWTKGELEVLDEPTASKFTLESVGGSWGGADDDEEDESDDEDNEFLDKRKRPNPPSRSPRREPVLEPQNEEDSLERGDRRSLKRS